MKNKKDKSFLKKLKHEPNIVEITHMCIRHGVHTSIYIYINKDGNPSTKSMRHVNANVNTRNENQNHQNSNIEVKDNNVKRAILCHESTSDGGALGDMCGRDQKL